MQLIVTGRHVSVTGAMKQYAREKLERIVTERPHLNEAHLILDVQKYRHLAEITVRGKNLELFCRGETPDMYASIDAAAAKLERQLRRFKERHTRRGRTARRLPRRAAPRDEAERDGITIRFPMNPMAADEAILQMKVQGHLFFAFLNADTGRVNLLVRPGPEEIGLLAPQKLQGPGRPAVFRMRVYREEALGQGRRPRIVRKEDRAVGWCSPEEAVEAMASEEETYRLFMDIRTKAPCVVYEQKGGDYGLIEAR
jgi:putative sigma-54 modulation protein